MTEQVIPAEAVEAAANYLSELLADYPADYSQEARELLEAAAPYVLATAYEQGWEDGREGNRDHMPPEPNNEGEK